MKATILADHLLAAVKETERVAPKRSTIPILANLLIGTKEGRVAVTASDLEQAVTAYVGAQIHEEGECTVPATLLKRMLTKIKGERIEFVGGEHGATLDIDGRTLKLDGYDPEDYPPVPEDFDDEAEVDGPTFKDRLQKVIVCVLGDDSRPHLAGVHMQGGQGTLTLEATDGYRLARFPLPYSGDPIACIVPSATIVTLIRLLDRSPGYDELPIDFSTNRIRFRVHNCDVASQLIPGTFPDCSVIIPTEWDRTVTVQPAELLRELDVARTIGAGKGFGPTTGVVRLVITDEGCLNISAKAEEVGSYSANIPADIEGQQGRTSVNGTFLRGLVQMFDGPVSLRWTDAGAPIHISENDDGLYVLMPHVVDWGKE